MTPRLTRAVAIFASGLCVLAALSLGLESQAENRAPDAPSFSGALILILAGTLTAWLADIWLRQGWEPHATVAEGLTCALVLLAIFFAVRAA